MKKPIASLTPNEIADALNLKPSFRGKQIFRWFSRGILDFKEMTDLPVEMREYIERNSIFSSSIDEVLKDNDGTLKFKVRLEDNLFIETVLLTDERERKTACLSVQVGCGMRCSFCRTGLMGLKRNLTDYEIVEQFLLILSYLRIHSKTYLKTSSEGNDIKNGLSVENIVFMGMGEPLENLTAVRKAIEIFHHTEGLGMSLRRITVSTCGIADKIYDLADYGPSVRLALSLVTADAALREKLMPVTKTNPLGSVRKALLYYQSKSGRRITLEIVHLKGINDRKTDVDALFSFTRGMNVVVNLIPWNPAEGMNFLSPDRSETLEFKRKIEARNIKVTERYRRGRGINGACGQLLTIPVMNHPAFLPERL